jgi:hypothetical protein
LLHVKQKKEETPVSRLRATITQFLFGLSGVFTVDGDVGEQAAVVDDLWQPVFFRPPRFSLD